MITTPTISPKNMKSKTTTGSELSSARTEAKRLKRTHRASAFFIIDTISLYSKTLAVLGTVELKIRVNYHCCGGVLEWCWLWELVGSPNPRQDEQGIV